MKYLKQYNLLYNVCLHELEYVNVFGVVIHTTIERYH